MSFLSNFVENIKRSLGAAADSSRDAWELAGLKSTLWMMKKQKNQLLQNLGAVVYEQFQKKKIDSMEINRMCRDVEETDLKIQEFEDKIQSISISTRMKIQSYLRGGKKTCLCGAPLSRDQRFCGTCGMEVEDGVQVSVPQEVITRQEVERVCFACGFKLRRGDGICPRCNTLQSL